jgi:hypothetical protein
MKRRTEDISKLRMEFIIIGSRDESCHEDYKLLNRMNETRKKKTQRNPLILSQTYRAMFSVC